MSHVWSRAWSLVAVILLTVILTLQIPRKALFFVPAHPRSSKPFVSFVTFKQPLYDELLQRAQMSWQTRRLVRGNSSDGLTDAFQAFPEPALPKQVQPADLFWTPPHALTHPSPLNLFPPSVALPTDLTPRTETTNETDYILHQELLALPPAE